MNVPRPADPRLAEAVAATRAAHARLRAELDRIHGLLAAGDWDPRIRSPWRHLHREILRHMELEEEQVLPALEALAEGRLPDPGFEAPLFEMQAERDAVRTLTDALREAAREAGPLEADLLTLCDDLDAHAEAEEERLYPAAVARIAALTGDNAASSAGPARLVRETRGRCNTCVADVPARVLRDDRRAWLEKTCPEHGVTTQLLSETPDYWEELDRYYFRVNAESYPQRDYIVRMTERCNLDCPICLAKANTEDTPDLDLSGLEELLTERRGIKVDLMAAEPTLRPDLEDWIRRVKTTGNIAALHTNGLKLANRAYAQRLKDAGVDEVFLQFDGMDDEANPALRGRPLLKARMKAMENMRELGIATSLIVVIARDLNEPQVGETLRFALRPENSHIREVFFLGLRVLGSARDTLRNADAPAFAGMELMPDAIIDLLCAQEPRIRREDIRAFNKLYFALLSAFRVKKCLYVQHYMLARGQAGAFATAAELLDLRGLEAAADRYAETLPRHPRLARARLLADLARHGVTRESARMLMDLARLQQLFQSGMNLREVPRRFLLLGFITACDPNNFDAEVAINCGKGELSADGGFVESGAVANVERERRFDETDRRPGTRRPGT